MIVADRPITDNPAAVDMYMLISMCRDAHCLPQEGGVLDQDSYIMFFWEVVLQAEAARKKIEQGRMEAKANSMK